MLHQSNLDSLESWKISERCYLRVSNDGCGSKKTVDKQLKLTANQKNLSNKSLLKIMFMKIMTILKNKQNHSWYTRAFLQSMKM